MKIKPLPKLILFLILVGILFYGAKSAMFYGLIPRPNALKSLVPIKTENIEAEVLEHNSNVKVVSLGKNSTSKISGPVIRFLVWEWNAQFGMFAANGGPFTTQESLVEKQGVKVQFIRQDDTNQMQNELFTFATSLEKGNPQPTVGAHFIAIMGDGAAAFLSGLNTRLTKLGPDYIAEVVGSGGYSRGEDKFMGLPEWKGNPQAAKGSLIAGVLRDGDWNIAMRWAQINDVPNNPDDSVYDPNALNWIAADTYIDAAQKYISNSCVDLPIKGTPSIKKHVCVNGSVTWTPGDVMIAEKRGGLVTLLSTKDAIFQMPNVIIGIKHWNMNNADKVAGMLGAFAQGSDQVRVNNAALLKAAEISTTIYKDQTPEYWAKYYRGVTKKDIQGNVVELGGSSVSNLADTLQLFGLSGGPNIFKATYETWGNVVVQQYPNIMKTYPSTESILNTRYIQMASTKINQSESAPAETPTYSTTTALTEILGKRNYNILFKTGSSEILAPSFNDLNNIVNDLITSNTLVIIHGHTDNTGSPSFNEKLSALRAMSVKQYFIQKGSSAIPSDRIKIVPHGQDEPIADNSTEQGRAQNRRVEIVLGK